MFNARCRVSGDEKDGTYEKVLCLKPYTLNPGMAYSIDLSLADEASNRETITTEDLISMNMPSQITVLGNIQPTDEPRLIDFSFSPKLIDPTVCTTVTFTARITANQSGLKYGSVRFRITPKAGEDLLDAGVGLLLPKVMFTPRCRTSGNDQDGIYEEKLYLKPLQLASGESYLLDMTLTDESGNRSTLVSSRLQEENKQHMLRTVL